MILLASGDFAEQKEILNKIVAYRCIVFLRNVAPSSATIHLFFCCLLGCFVGFFDHLNTFSNPSHDRYGHAVA